MIRCSKCEKPLDLHASVKLRFPKHATRICDDCALLFDHINEPDLPALLEPVT